MSSSSSSSSDELTCLEYIFTTLVSLIPYPTYLELAPSTSYPFVILKSTSYPFVILKSKRTEVIRAFEDYFEWRYVDIQVWHKNFNDVVTMCKNIESILDGHDCYHRVAELSTMYDQLKGFYGITLIYRIKCEL